MNKTEVSRATLSRIPAYLKYLKSLSSEKQNISATTISKELGLGEVKVRKDLCTLCGSGKPRVGYLISELTASLEGVLKSDGGDTVIIGAGKLGRALLDYDGFEAFGISILAAFDKKVTATEQSPKGKLILPMKNLSSFCNEHTVKIGVIAVPQEAAQQVCNLLCENGIKAIWCFAPCKLYKPADAVIQYENIALSLAHLKMKIK